MGLHPRSPGPTSDQVFHDLPVAQCEGTQAKKDASRFRALVLIGVAAAFCAGFNPHVTKPRVASKLAETEHADVCPPHWLPVHLAARPSHIDSPAPRFDEEALPFEDDNELLSMKRRMTEPTALRAHSRYVWECYKLCNHKHYDSETRSFKQSEHSLCKALCPPIPSIMCSPPVPPSPPPPSPPRHRRHPRPPRRRRWCRRLHHVWMCYQTAKH